MIHVNSCKWEGYNFTNLESLQCCWSFILLFQCIISPCERFRLIVHKHPNQSLNKLAQIGLVTQTTSSYTWRDLRVLCKYLIFLIGFSLSLIPHVQQEEYKVLSPKQRQTGVDDTSDFPGGEWLCPPPPPSPRKKNKYSN